MSNELLREEVEALKMLLDHEGYDYQDGAEDDVMESLSSLEIPETYDKFLRELNPGDSEWRIGKQFSLNLHSADELPEWQSEIEQDAYFAIGRFNDQPLVVERREDDDMGPAVYQMDADGEYQCVGTSFVQFLRIVRTGLDMLTQLADFDEDSEDEDDESYDDFNDYGETSFERDREGILSDYYEEIERIDPDCAEAWRAV